MGDLTRNFSRNEFACNGGGCCGHSSPMDRVFLEKLQDFRDIAGVPVKVTSGFRCNIHNKNINGAKNSYHTLGLASDIKCALPVERMVEIAQKVGFNGIGIYSNRIHVDDRQVPARWNG